VDCVVYKAQQGLVAEESCASRDVKVYTAHVKKNYWEKSKIHSSC